MLAGTPGAIEVRSRWLIITAGAWVAMAASNGGRSCASISARVESSTGSVSWLSLVAVPWPGKCLTVETMPAAS